MPSITFWTRIEPFSRLEDIDEGLQAATHDPLWLLTRQWQTGEFVAEDAGTPVQARLRHRALAARALPCRCEREQSGAVPGRYPARGARRAGARSAHRGPGPRSSPRRRGRPLLPRVARPLQGHGGRTAGVRRRAHARALRVSGRSRPGRGALPGPHGGPRPRWASCLRSAAAARYDRRPARLRSCPLARSFLRPTGRRRSKPRSRT